MSVVGLGIWVSFPVYGVRAGFGKVGPNWREFLAPNLPFFALLIAKAFVWPAVMAYWLAQGRPRSPWQAVAVAEDGRQLRQVVRVGAVRRSGGDT